MNTRVVPASMTLRYVSVLLLLAILAGFNYWLLGRGLEDNRANSLVLNLLTRQRAEVERIDSLSQRVATETDPTKQADLRTSLTGAAKVLKDTHASLVNGDAEVGIPAEHPPELDKIYFGGNTGLDRRMTDFSGAVYAMLEETPESLGPDNANLARIRELATDEQLLATLDEAIAFQQKKGAEQLARLENLQRVALGLTLVILLLTALLVFRPMQKKIQEELENLRKFNETLEQRVAERSAAAEDRAKLLADSELAMRQQSAILKSILDSMGDGVCVCDLQGTFLLFNPAAERILGIGPDNAPPEEWSEHFGLYLPDRVTPYPSDQLPLRRAMQGEKVDRAEIFVRPASGPAGIWLSSTARPLIDANGETKGGVVVFHDSTRRKTAEEALRNSEALYGSLVENLPLHYFRKDMDGQLTFGNQRYCKIMGRDLEDMIGKTDFDLFPFELAEKYLGDDHRVTDSGQPFEDIEEHRKPNGELLYVQVLKAPVYDAEKNIIGVQGIFWDVTDRQMAEFQHRRTEAELARSNEELQQFALIASHDLQEPLRKVRAFGDQLRAKYASVLDERGLDYVDRMQSAAGRMHQLINDLLSLARVTTQGRPFMPVELNSIAKETLEDLQARIEQSQASVEIGDLPVIDADPLQMRQLFQNLIGNALKFQQPDKPPVVRVTSEAVPHPQHNDENGHQGPVQPQIRILVQDNGIGFDEKYLDRIFTVFQRLHGRGEYEGTGVGLAICRRIAERHGGTITAFSQPGQGSTFVVTLAIKHAAAGSHPSMRITPEAAETDAAPA